MNAWQPPALAPAWQSSVQRIKMLSKNTGKVRLKRLLRLRLSCAFNMPLARARARLCVAAVTKIADEVIALWMPLATKNGKKAAASGSAAATPSTPSTRGEWQLG